MEYLDKVMYLKKNTISLEDYVSNEGTFHIESGILNSLDVPIYVKNSSGKFRKSHPPL